MKGPLSPPTNRSTRSQRAKRVAEARRSPGGTRNDLDRATSAGRTLPPIRQAPGRSAAVPSRSRTAIDLPHIVGPPAVTESGRLNAPGSMPDGIDGRDTRSLSCLVLLATPSTDDRGGQLRWHGEPPGNPPALPGPCSLPSRSRRAPCHRIRSHRLRSKVAQPFPFRSTCACQTRRP